MKEVSEPLVEDLTVGVAVPGGIMLEVVGTARTEHGTWNIGRIDEMQVLHRVARPPYPITDTSWLQ